MADHRDPLNGAIAYIDGAIELYPKLNSEARRNLLLRPLRKAFQAGELMAVLWATLLMLPGVGVAIILDESPLVFGVVTIAAAVAVWITYAFAASGRDSLESSETGTMLVREIEKADVFLSEAQRSQRFGTQATWEGGHPIESHPRTMLRILRRTRSKLDWLRNQPA
ncbi:MAG: hypothetical protein KC561_02970 [Myxococcales bacterium]|nr:hypothetical protein [Myxococcales bacterium]